MKWLKHYSNSLNSESLSDLIRDTGFQGYGRYWVLLEHLAGIFDGNTTSFRVPIENVRGLFRIRSWTELETFTDRLSTVRGLNLKRSGNVFEIEASILLDLLGKDFRVARHARVKLAPKNKNKNKIKDKEYTTPELDFEPAYNLYRLKKGKSKGLEKLKKEIKTSYDVSLLIKAIENYNKDLDINKTEIKYIKHFSTFASEWRDWIEYSPPLVQHRSGFENTRADLIDDFNNELQRIKES